MGVGAPGMGGVRQPMAAQFNNPGQPIGFQTVRLIKLAHQTRSHN